MTRERRSAMIRSVAALAAMLILLSTTAGWATEPVTTGYQVVAPPGQAIGRTAPGVIPVQSGKSGVVTPHHRRIPRHPQPAVDNQHNFGPSYPFGYNYKGPSYPFGNNYTAPSLRSGTGTTRRPRLCRSRRSALRLVGCTDTGGSSGCRSTTRTMRGCLGISPAMAPGFRGTTSRRPPSPAATTSGSGWTATGPSEGDARDGVPSADGARPDAELRLSHRGSRDA